MNICRLGMRLLAVALVLCTTPLAHAVPSFARQTGLECTACHLSWLELTTVGRQFKLGGYTLMKPVVEGERPVVSFAKDGNAPLVPLAAFAQAAVSHTANTSSPGTSSSDYPRQNELVLQQFSVFLAGRASDHVGGFLQWTYDGIEHHSSVDNMDVRVANSYRSASLDVDYGLSLNNNPTMSDIFNTTPTWGFPFASSATAPAPSAATLIDGGLAQQVAGLSAYSMWNHTLYAELGAYRTADRAFSIFREGIDRSSAAVLSGHAPYWRLALQHEWDSGAQSAMVGAYGFNARKYPDPTQPTGLTDSFHDLGFDAQYQYVTDLHRVGAQLNFIHERQLLDATFAAGGSSNPSDHLKTLNAKLTYYYLMKYGVTLGYRKTTGDTDAGLYSNGDPIDGSANGSPNSAAVILELNWLPWRDRRFSLQYTAYTRFNGGSTNYDGFGRNAHDNDTLYFVAWFPF
jgi:hypothetical protein